MTLYEGNLFGFAYSIEKATDQEFIDWLKAKFLKYVLKNTNERQVIKELLGLDVINARLDALESP